MSDDSGNSDDEYGPIASTWGDQTANVPSDVREIDVIAGWRSLSDPNAKIGASGLGSGGLHRKGKNYKPVDEELILKHRKNGAGLGSDSKRNKQKKSINGGATVAVDGKKQHHPKPKDKRSQEQRQPPRNDLRSADTKNHSSTRSIAHQSWVAPPTGKNNHDNRNRASRLSSERGPSPLSKSTWSNQSLVEEPFWETASLVSSTTTPQNENGLPSVWGKTSKTEEEKALSYPETSWGPNSANKDSTQIDKSSAELRDTTQATWTEWSSSQITTDVGWQASEDWHHVMNDGWGQCATAMTRTSTQPSQSSNRAKLHSKVVGEKDQITNGSAAVGSTNSDGGCRQNGHSDGSKALTAESQHILSTSNTGSGGRFSNTSRPKYSNRNRTKPRPVNYYDNIPLAPPKEVAPPPPMDNPIVVTINIELDEGNKIPVDIRLHDDPKQLAYQFGRNHLIDSAEVMDALCNLLQTQKINVLKKRRRKPL
ncbi:hypothetical protein BX666DRAFT_1917291 [Dichotomocladium elegans]|nr:hypothetical protein BX666DRAFT_1917291 [Dichotomocladium elegans]